MAAGDIDLGARIGKLEARVEDLQRAVERMQGADDDDEEDDNGASPEAVDPVLGVTDSQLDAGIGFIAGEIVSAFKSKKAARSAGAPKIEAKG